jgi:lysophospholipid acyltransferase (LPLAT)-like uncharacterized protein
VSAAGERFVMAVVPFLGYAFVRLLRRTMRVEYRNRDVLDRARSTFGAYILVFWHSRFVMMPYAYPDRRLAVLSSRHRDSRMLGQVLRRFGVENVWGASRSGSAAGLRPLLRKATEGYDLALTPDGPLGPRRRAQPGAIAAARSSGLPLIPLAFSARPARRLRSWDRTLVPYPFARGVFVFGEPMPVAPRADAAERERARRELEAELDRLTDQADRRVGLPVEEPRPPSIPASVIE